MENNAPLEAEKRKDKIKNWLKNPHNLIFILILIFAFIIRLYYFNLTKTQPLWWDESDYLAYAKNLAGFPANWIITTQHSSLYPYMAAIFFKFGMSEAIAKFFLQIMPSIFSVLLVYLICNAMCKDKRVALISAFLMAIFWDHLFETMRFHIDVLGLFLGLLSIYVFWQGYENKDKIFGKIDAKWAIPITIIFVILTYTIRRGYFLFGIFFLVHMLATRKWTDLIKDKYNWISLALLVFLFFLAEKFIFISQIGGVSGTYFHPENKINLLPLGVFPAYFSSSSSILSILLYLFWIGLLLIISNIFLSFDYIKKTRNSMARSDLFNLIAIIVTLAFFILIIRTPDVFGEPRWFFPLALAAFISISRASIFLTDLIKPYNKYVALIILVALLGIGGYYELKIADSSIKNKITSFDGIKQASLYLREISNENDLIVSVAVPQVIYYAERNVVQPDKIAQWTESGDTVPLENFLSAVSNAPETKYLLISFSQPGHPDWMTRVYANNGQVAAWEIPFMDTKIDFVNKQQDIKQSKNFEDITFNLINIKQDVFIYEIKRQDDKLV